MRNPFAAAARALTTERKFAPAQLLPAWQHRQPQWTEWDTEKAIREGFKASTWVYRCIQLKMEAVASVPLVAYTMAADEWIVDAKHPLTQFWARPNPFLSRARLMEMLVAQLELGGNGLFWHVLVDGGRRLREVWPLQTRYAKPVPDKNEWIGSYVYDVQGFDDPIPADEVAHVLYVDPDNPYWGMSPLQAAAKVVDTDVAAVTWNKATLDNRAVPDGIFTVAQPITRDQREELREAIADEYAGPTKARASLILSNGTTYQQTGLSPVDMDHLKGREWNRGEIAAAYGVPELMLGAIGQGSTYANYETARRVFWEDTIIPLLKRVADAIGQVEIGRIEADPSRVMLGFDLTDVPALRDDFGKKVEQYGKLVERGVPANMAAQRVELDLPKPIPGGDVGLVPATLVPITMAGEGDPEQPPQDDPDAL